MSRSPCFYVERYDKNTNRYELQHPIVWNYNHTRQVEADLFPYNGCHDLFSIVEDKGKFPQMKGIHDGLPKDCCKEISDFFEIYSYDTKWDGETHHIEPKVHWFTYADMYIYCLEHPEVPDYEAMDEVFYNEEEEEEENPPKQIMKQTPLQSLKHRVDAFLEVMDGYDWHNDYSLIRIVYWIL